MDTSETYIKMCEKAGEIQEPWKPQCGDIFCYYGEPPIVGKNPIHYKIIAGKDGKATEGELIPTEVVRRYYRNLYYWLPCQDQLQGMYGDYHKCLDFLHDFQCPEVNYWHPKNFDPCSSMEQLWMAVVMRERWNKIWNGDDWIKS